MTNFNIEDKCKSIIKNNNSKDAISKISELKINNRIIGYKDAVKIYNRISSPLKNVVVKYDINNHKNNITSYKNKTYEKSK